MAGKQNRKMNKKNKKGRKSGKARGVFGASSVARYLTPFPPKTVRSLRYSTVVNVVEAAAQGGGYYVFTPSSLYDPDNTGAGHQPMYFDQLCSSVGPYTRYRGLKTEAKITLANTSAAICWAGVYVSSVLTTPSSPTQFYEKPGTKMCSLMPVGIAQSSRVFRMSIPHAQALGISERHLRDDDGYAGAYNSSPSWNFGLIVGLVGVTGAAQSLQILVELFITAEFFSLGNEATS
jgi:hypothetical protein